MQPVALDVLIFGGGIAGLWLLDELRRAGFAALLAEAHALGQGQTIRAQGIIHGGLKYSLLGAVSESARAVRGMPDLWKGCLRGELRPDLRETRVVSDFCYIWRTEALHSRLGLLGARRGLRTAVRKVPEAERPEILKTSPGDVFRVEEPVIDPSSLIRNLLRWNRRRILKVDEKGVEIRHGTGNIHRVRLQASDAAILDLRPHVLLFAAGEGNQRLRSKAGLAAGAMQRRPLRMAMVRGEMPPLYGHCVDGARTRVTITSSTDSRGRTVWQVGGNAAEVGVEMAEDSFRDFARQEIEASLPGIDLRGTQWTDYRVDRAEGSSRGIRPPGPTLMREGNAWTVWPTKLALAPLLARQVLKALGKPEIRSFDESPLAAWPRPEVALPPWEMPTSWS